MCHPYSCDICLHAYSSSYFSRIASNYDDMGAEDHGRSKPWQNMSATLIAVFVARSRSCPRSTVRTKSEDQAEDSNDRHNRYIHVWVKPDD
jgi:hypothetical protein